MVLASIYRYFCSILPLPILICGLLVLSSEAQNAAGPIAKKGLLAALEKKALTSQELIGEINKYGVSFKLTPADEEEIRRAGKYLGKKGLNELVEVVRNNFRVLLNKADVALRFVYPKSPALVILNQSDVVVREIKWTVVLWNLNIPDRLDPLPIPVSTFDWLRPHDKGGPQTLFGIAGVAPLVKPGDRLVGSATVICPECTRGRTYFVYIIYDNGGWFAEVENEQSGHLFIPANTTKEGLLDYLKIIENQVPEGSRVPIEGLNKK